jgi:Trk K+ transport system NAD-binding subunit
MTPADDMSDHVIVCGLGHVGYRIVRMLIRLGQRGTVVAREINKDWQAAVEPHFRVIAGDAREDALLCEAGIGRAKAILAVTDNDLANVSIALDAQRLNPRIAVTVRIFDQKLAAHLESTMRINRALSTSALAAPAFVAAASGGSVHGAFETDGTHWTVESESVPAGSPWESVTIAEADFGLRALIAIERGQDLFLRPAADMKLAAGDRLTFLAPAGSGPVSTRKKANRWAWLRGVMAGTWEWWHETPMALRITFTAMVLLFAFSVVAFRVALHMPLIDAVYFVISTITTVGYGDYNLHDASPWVKVFGCVLMLCGAAMLALIVSLVTDFVLRTRLRDVIARGSARAKGHIIVAGLGNIGFRLVQSLHRNGEQIVAIDRREDCQYVSTAREMAAVVLGNVQTEETLRKAGAAGAKALLAVTNDDIANLSIALAAKRARPDCRVVARIFDSTLAEKMERSLGLDAVLSVSAAAAPTFVASVLCPGVLQGLVLRDHLILVFQRTIGGGLAGAKSPCGEAADREAILWRARLSDGEYQVIKSGEPLVAGERVLGIGWRPFR